MNLKETIISSSFFHLILFLLMAAVSNYTSGSYGGFQNVVSVDLTMEHTKDLPDSRIEPAEEPPLVSTQQPIEDIKSSQEEEAVSILPDESEETSKPEEKVETAEPAKIAKVEQPPVQAGGFTSMEAYHQFIVLHKKMFGQKAGVRVNELLGEALKVNTRQFYGGVAVVSLNFGPDGRLNEFFVDSESPDLKAFFEEMVWDAVPAPAQFSLRFTGVQIEFTVHQGYMSFEIEAL
jgi:hypothetical protein